MSIFLDGSFGITASGLSVGTNATIGNISSSEVDTLNGVTSAIQTQLNGKEPTIAAGNTAQYWRGDKTWQIIDLSGYATKASPTFTGTVTLPASTVATTKSVGDSTTNVATTAFVSAEIANDAPLKSPSAGIPVNYIWSGTQAQYDAIGTKDANTVYIIV